jgi:LacI family transcriptional regulator
MATIKDVAKLAGVSIATVSRVINNSPKTGETARDSVRRAMEELNYRPDPNARALVSKVNDTIGCMVFDVADPFFGAMVKAIEIECRAHQKHLLIGNGSHDAAQERETIELLISKRCEALIIHSKALSNEELTAYAKKFPGMIFINRLLPEIPSRCIWLDNYYGSYTVTQHLIELGHRHIACVASKYDIEDAYERIRGYRDAIQELGLNPDEIAVERAEPNEEGGEQAIQDLLGRGMPFTAVVAYNDAMATGIISVLIDNGFRVPEDVSVVGFDDVIFARFSRPKLTTMRYPISMMATKATQMALRLATGEAPESTAQVFRPVLVRRQSSAAAPQEIR